MPAGARLILAALAGVGVFALAGGTLAAATERQVGGEQGAGAVKAADRVNAPGAQPRALAPVTASRRRELARFGQAAQAQVAEGEGEGAEPPSGRPETALYGFQPLTPWRQPPVTLPAPAIVNYAGLAAEGLRQTRHWRHGGWYCEYLGCSGKYPLATIWATVPVFETVDALQTAEPSPAHQALVQHLGRESEHFWDRALVVLR